MSFNLKKSKMNENEELIKKFYTALANQDATIMASCYHTNIVFQDPVFGILRGKEASKMWQMLIENSKGNLKIVLSNVISTTNSGSATWVATYNFSKTNRKVINIINATFEFKDGLIIKHNDTFDLWKWSSQAFGLKGFLLGWTGFMQRKIQEQARISLGKFQN
jgi:ketosteroid isomerase-like protein